MNHFIRTVPVVLVVLKRGGGRFFAMPACALGRVELHHATVCSVTWAVLVCAALFVAGVPSAARGAGVVGTGTSASCTDAALNTALAGGGLVTFNCGGPATIDISGGTGTKMIAADTTLDGEGLVTISGGDRVGVFHVSSGATFIVRNLTIANGRFARGGGIENEGTTTVINSTLSGNRGPLRVFGAGGILNATGQNPGTIAVTDSAFIANSGGIGGGIGSEGGSVTVSNTTFTGNSSLIGGGIASLGGSLTVTNSAFSDNDGTAGGIGSYAESLTVTNSTFTSNRAFGPLTGAAGGIGNFGGSLTVINSTFTRNSGVASGDFSGGAIGVGIDVTSPPLLRNTILASNTPGDNCFGVVTDGGHNLDDGSSCGFSTANGSLSSTDPQLDPAGARDNGGPTQTVALCAAVGVPAGCSAASPAIDAGDQALCATPPVNNLDQRGFVRPGAGHANCSIGAYEADATQQEATPTPTVTPTPTSRPAACIGDCNANGMVAINELLLGVNIVLGRQPVDACLAFGNSPGMVDIAQLIKGVNNALKGCG
jgi:hypothetical protein